MTFSSAGQRCRGTSVPDPATCRPVRRAGPAAAEEADEEQDSDDLKQKYTVKNARKSRTFFFNALDADGFDTVINPVVIEPVVQFTLYLKVKYEIEQPPK